MAKIDGVWRFLSPLTFHSAASYSALTPEKQSCALLVAAGLWFAFGGKVIFRNGKLVTFLPSFVYELVQHACFHLNWAIDALCYLQPARSEWNEGDASTSVQALRQKGGADVDSIKTSILEGKGGSYKEDDLVRLFDSLPAVKTEELLVGRAFDGRILRTNASVLDLAEWLIIKPLKLLGFNWGKRYLTQHRGDPLMFNWLRRFYFPFPLWGNVCVTDIKWRGVSTGTMNYDSQNWKDYFRVLDSDPVSNKLVLLGVWTARSKAGGWFTLTYNPQVPVS